MKAAKFLLAATLFAGLASLSLAGPGSDYWAQQTKNAKEQKTAQQLAQNLQKSCAPAQICSRCSDCCEIQKS